MNKKVLSVSIKIIIFFAIGIVLGILNYLFKDLNIVIAIIAGIIGWNMDHVFNWVDNKIYK